MKRLTGHLYFWVLLAIFAGGTLGYFEPEIGVSLKPLGDGFIAGLGHDAAVVIGAIAGDVDDEA